MSNKPVRILALVLVLVAALAAVQVLAKPSSAPGEQEFFGVVESVGTNTMTVAGHVIDITNAEFKSVISVGDFVKVHFTVSPATGMWIASEVEPALVFEATGEATLEATEDVAQPEATEIEDVNEDRATEMPHIQHEDHGSGQQGSSQSGQSGQGSSSSGQSMSGQPSQGSGSLSGEGDHGGDGEHGGDGSGHEGGDD